MDNKFELNFDNQNYFDESKKNNEDIIDPEFYKEFDKQIIPLEKDSDNKLTLAYKELIDTISNIQKMLENPNIDVNDEKVVNELKNIIELLKTDNMNLSPFCQYFGVHNLNYSIFSKLNSDKKLEVLKFIIKPYIEDRHKIYLKQGYSNIVLQVLSDTYSHKRKGNYGTKKISKILESNEIHNLVKIGGDFLKQKRFYLLSDKNGKKIYKNFCENHNITMHDDENTTEKYPDALIRINNDYFIVEHKNMKEAGGGQDKQVLEIIKFIEKEPEFFGLHYVTYIDGIYFDIITKTSNFIDEKNKTKALEQYKDIITALSKYKSNYFVNTYGFTKLIQDFLEKSIIEDISN